MKNLIYLAILAVISAFLVSCGDILSTRIEIDPPEFEDEMTLTTFVDAYSVNVNMFVGKNKSIFEEGNLQDYALEDAKITITKESEGISLDSDTDGIDSNNGIFNYSLVFFNNDFFTPGDQYTFKLEHADFESSITTLDFPSMGAVLENIVYKREDGLDAEFDQASSITFDIVDNPDRNDFYELEASTDQGWSATSFWISCLDPIAKKGRPNDNLLISDETFNGEKKRLKIRFDRYLYDPQDGGTIELKFRTVNEGYYKNSISLAKYYETEGTPFTSPVQIHSNVNGALGNISFRTTEIYTVQ